jgi:putative thioredoxin
MSYELQDFRKEVVEQSKVTPVVLDFWAEWCGPCRTLGPIIERLAEGAKGKWKLVKINTEVHQQLAAQFGIKSIPAVKMVYNGALVAEFTGALPEAQIRQWLKDNLPNASEQEDEEYEKLLEQAQQTGDRVESHRLLEQIINAKQGNDTHLAALSMSWLPDDPGKALEILAGREAESKFDIHVQVIETVSWLRSLAEPAFGDNPHTQTFSISSQNLFSHEYEQAIQGFLEILSKDRVLHQDGGRRALVAIFTLLGEHHPLTKTYRRRFSMLLY